MAYEEYLRRQRRADFPHAMQICECDPPDGERISFCSGDKSRCGLLRKIGSERQSGEEENVSAEASEPVEVIVFQAEPS